MKLLSVRSVARRLDCKTCRKLSALRCYERKKLNSDHLRGAGKALEIQTSMNTISHAERNAAILREYDEGGTTYAELAVKFGVSISRIEQILRREMRRRRQPRT